MSRRKEKDPEAYRFENYEMTAADFNDLFYALLSAFIAQWLKNDHSITMIAA
jgi:hypothetical protein